jgi:hypothetical protein
LPDFGLDRTNQVKWDRLSAGTGNPERVRKRALKRNPAAPRAHARFKQNSRTVVPGFRHGVEDARNALEALNPDLVEIVT